MSRARTQGRSQWEADKDRNGCGIGDEEGGGKKVTDFANVKGRVDRNSYLMARKCFI